MHSVIRIILVGLSKLLLPPWFFVAKVVNPFQWTKLKVIFKSFVINMVIKSTEGLTINGRKASSDEKRQAATTALTPLVFAGWIKPDCYMNGQIKVTAEEKLKQAIAHGVKQLTALSVLPPHNNVKI
jgi:hypothetical protein